MSKTLSFGQNLFAKNEFQTPIKTCFDKIDEKFNKSPKSSESSTTSRVLKPTIFSPVLINAKSNGMSLPQSISKLSSTEKSQL
jgi:hypothetical protein